MTDFQQVRKGSTELLILRILDDAPLHGYAIMRELETRSQGYFTITAALLYPTLHQMEKDGLVQATWEPGAGQRRRKVYAITPSGRDRLAQGRQEWRRFTDRLFGMMGGASDIRGLS